MNSENPRAISPAEYYYLSNLITGSTAEMLKLTLQDLCVREILEIEWRSIIVDIKYGKHRPRIFFKRGSKFHDYKSNKAAEDFFLQLFEDREELRLFSIRTYIKDEIENNSFNDLIYQDLKNRKLCFLRVFASPSAIRQRTAIHKVVEDLNRNYDSLIKSSPKDVAQKITDLGTHILHLDEEILEKIQENSDSLKQIGIFDLPQSVFNSTLFSSIAVFSSLGAGGLGGFGGGGGAGGFGGFGGGSFGGGGAMGSW